MLILRKLNEEEILIGAIQARPGTIKMKSTYEDDFNNQICKIFLSMTFEGSYFFLV